MAFTAVAAAVSVGSSVAAASARFSAAKKAAKIRKEEQAVRVEAQATQEAGEQNRNRISRRTAIRDERVRRARLTQLAVNVGGAESSTALVAPGIIGTNTAAAISSQTGQTKAAQGVSRSLQQAADLSGQAKEAVAEGELFASIATGLGGAVSSGITQAGKLDVFKKTP